MVRWFARGGFIVETSLRAGDLGEKHTPARPPPLGGGRYIVSTYVGASGRLTSQEDVHGCLLPGVWESRLSNTQQRSSLLLLGPCCDGSCLCQNGFDRALGSSSYSEIDQVGWSRTEVVIYLEVLTCLPD